MNRLLVLDPLLTAYVATIIQELAQEGYIVLVATHDTSLLERLNCTIYLMSQGKIVETAYYNNYKKIRMHIQKLRISLQEYKCVLFYSY